MDPFSGKFYEQKIDDPQNKLTVLPGNLIEYWEIILTCLGDPVYKTIEDMREAPDWWDAAYSLMAIADLAAKNAGFKRDSNNNSNKELVSCWSKLAERIIKRASDRPRSGENNAEQNESKNKHPEDEIERRKAFKSIRYVESISLAERSIVNIMPKSKTASLGCTLRCISHNLANLPGKGIIRTGWAWATDPPKYAKQNPVFNMLLIPYPYEIHSTNFTATAISQNISNNCEDASRLRWGAFTLNVPVNNSEDEEFIAFVSRLIREGNERVGKIHAIVLPELALSRKSIVQLRNRITAHHPSIELICSGMREHPYKDGKSPNKPIPVNGAIG